MAQRVRFQLNRVNFYLSLSVSIDFSTSLSFSRSLLRSHSCLRVLCVYEPTIEIMYATEEETTNAPHLFDCFIYIPNFYV